MLKIHGVNLFYINHYSEDASQRRFKNVTNELVQIQIYRC